MEKVFIDPAKIDYSLIVKVRDILTRGGIVAVPTETVYGLAACVNNKEAAKKLYEIKQRPQDKPFTIAVDIQERANSYYFSILPPFGYRLMERFWPGPLTIIYYSKKDEKIGIRVPAHPVANAILKAAGALYLPSANISGQPEATKADDIEKTFASKIDLLVDSGESSYKQPSTVVDLTLNPFGIVRQGVVLEHSLVDVFVRKRILFVCTGNTCRSPMAQFILEKYIDESRPYLRERYEILSAGIYAYDGSPASGSIVTLLRDKESINIKGFHSTKLNRHLILSSDLIFTMEDIHTEYVLNLERSAEGRVFPLRKFLTGEHELDIPDPIGKGFKDYQDSYDLIKEAIVELKEWL